MVSLVVVLFFLSFIQSSVVSGDWVIAVLIARSFIVPDKQNYYLAFIFGLLCGFLSAQPLGFLSLIYLLAVKLTTTFRKFASLPHWLMVVPLTLAILLLEAMFRLLVFGTSIQIAPIIYGSISVLPILAIVKFWEERFIPKSEIRLKLGRK